MQPVIGPPIWAVYLVTKRDLIVIPIALGLAILLAIRVSRSLGRAERSPHRPLSLLPGWLTGWAVFCLFYVGISQSLTGLSVLVQTAGAGLNWSFNPPFAPVVPNEPVYFFDAGVLLIAALWILLTGREYVALETGDEVAPDGNPDPAAEQPSASR